MMPSRLAADEAKNESIDFRKQLRLALGNVWDVEYEKPSISGGLNHRATRFVAEWPPHPLTGTTLPGKGRLARASSALLWMHVAYVTERPLIVRGQSSAAGGQRYFGENSRTEASSR